MGVDPHDDRFRIAASTHDIVDELPPVDPEADDGTGDVELADPADSDRGDERAGADGGDQLRDLPWGRGRPHRPDPSSTPT